jgi:hypothetical protein
MSTSDVGAVVFVRDLQGVATFYAKALGMRVAASDEHHFRLDCRGFERVVHQIPRHIAENIVIERPPKRRMTAALRLDYPVDDLAASRKTARLARLCGRVVSAPRRRRNLEKNRASVGRSRGA